MTTTDNMHRTFSLTTKESNIAYVQSTTISFTTFFSSLQHNISRSSQTIRGVNGGTGVGSASDIDVKNVFFFLSRFSRF